MAYALSERAQATSRQIVYPLVLAVVISRGVVLLAAAAAETLLTRNPLLTSGDGSPILRSLTAWDGWWYLGIARNGYHVDALTGNYHDYAFLPLWPALVRLASWPWPTFTGLVSIVLANVLFVVGLLILVRLGERVVGPERAVLGASILALLPFSAVFSMAYGESLFLVLSTAAFLAAERNHRPAAGLLVGLAALTRLQGVALALPVWLVLFLRDGPRIRPSQAWVLLGPLAAAALFLAVGIFAGGGGAYGAAQSAWGRTGIGGAALGEALGQQLTLINAVQLATLLVAVFLLVYLRPDRIPSPYGLVSILTIALVFLSGSLESIGRHVTTAFPNSWILAGRKARWFRIGWPILSTVLLFVFTTAMFAGRFVP